MTAFDYSEGRPTTLNDVLALQGTRAADDLPITSYEWHLRLIIAAGHPGIAERAWFALQRFTFNEFHRTSRKITHPGWPTAADLRAASDDDLSQILNFGVRSVRVVRRALDGEVAP